MEIAVKIIKYLVILISIVNLCYDLKSLYNALNMYFGKDQLHHRIENEIQDEETVDKLYQSAIKQLSFHLYHNSTEILIKVVAITLCFMFL